MSKQEKIANRQKAVTPVEDEEEDEEEVEDAPPVVTPQPLDYSQFTADQLLEAIGKAWQEKDMKLMGTLSKLHVKRTEADEKVKKDTLLKELATLTLAVKKAFDAQAQQLLDTKLYDGADGFWYYWDFGEKLSSCRLTRKESKVSSSGTSVAAKSTYVSNPAKSNDLLAEVGKHIYVDADTKVIIDKAEHLLHAGMTFTEAYEFSTNGGWRNRVRMALLKESGLV